METVIATIKLFTRLGFIIHPEKSSFITSQRMKLLGFILNSKEMTVKPTQDRIVSIRNCCMSIMQSKNCFKIQDIARVLGKLISCFPAALFGSLFYRQIEKEKTMALKCNKGNFDSTMMLSQEAMLELQWSHDNIETVYKPLITEKITMLITTDACLKGWGATCNGVATGGVWSIDEKEHHINYLEMHVVFLGLKTFANNLRNVHIKVLSDNSTTVLVLTRMGTSKSNTCNSICKSILLWCIQHNIWLTIAHIPGKQNTEADNQSRLSRNMSHEWKLNPEILHSCLRKFNFFPQIDLFAIRPN